MSGRRDWFAVYARLVHQPKFRRLSESAQLTLCPYLWALAADQSPEALWPSVEALRDLLDFHGRPASDLDELLAARWLDLEPDGSVSVHDWDEHQWAASKEIKKVWEARRLRDWRRSKATPPAVSPSSLEPSPSISQDRIGEDRDTYAYVREEESRSDEQSIAREETTAKKGNGTAVPDEGPPCDYCPRQMQPTRDGAYWCTNRYAHPERQLVTRDALGVVRLTGKQPARRPYGSSPSS
ncbi:MAG: hypothetical protein ACLQBX_00500 [Candidatus Limnocylindrales bacterium]